MRFGLYLTVPQSCIHDQSHLKRCAIDFQPCDLLLILRTIFVDLIPELRIVSFVVEVTQLMDNQVINDACGSHHHLPVENLAGNTHHHSSGRKKKAFENQIYMYKIELQSISA